MHRMILIGMVIVFAGVLGPALGTAQDLRPRAAVSAEMVSEIERMYMRVLRSLDETRRAGRAEHARCMDTKLSHLSATLRLARERLQRLTRYERVGDSTMIEREHALVARLLPRAREIEHEAQRCAEPDAPPNRTRVTVTVDPNVPEDAVEEPRRTDLNGAVHD